jgi:hypothetical protein
MRPTLWLTMIVFMALAASAPVDAAKRTTKPTTAAPCPKYRPASRGTLPRAITELSGWAFSKRHANVLWGHNDSGGGARLFAVSTVDGTMRAEVIVSGTKAVDWEDVATYTDADGQYWIVIADTGDNSNRRKNVSLVLIPEPELSATKVAAAGSVTIQWADGPHDVEALLLDPWSGDAYLIGKRFSETSEVSIDRVAAASMKPGASLTAEKIGMLPIPLGQPYGPTAGSVSPDGSQVALVYYGNLTQTWTRTRNVNLGDTIRRGKSCVVRTGFGQYEAVAIANNATVYVATEGESVPIDALVPVRTR